jgi:hypothetical protein
MIVPDTYVNDTPVARYRDYVTANRLQGMVTLGARLWDVQGKTPIDLDYTRGFLSEDILPGGSADVVIQMRAPKAPGIYCVTFDAVDEYVTWFSSEGSLVAVEYLAVIGEGALPDSRTPRRLHATLQLVDQPQPGVLVMSFENTGDTVWLRGPLHRGGSVQVGLQRIDATGHLVNRDWLRFPLPRTVMPGESVRMRLDIASVVADDVPAVRVDLVSEHRCWFSDRGTEPLTVSLRSWAPRA